MGDKALTHREKQLISFALDCLDRVREYRLMTKDDHFRMAGIPTDVETLDLKKKMGITSL